MESLTTAPRPPALAITKSCIYKTVGKLLIYADIYCPTAHHGACSIMLFIHGGSWFGRNRKDYCRALFQRFIQRGFIVVLIDYRLCPETSLDGQLEDIRDVESWLRDSLPSLFAGLRVDTDKIIVVGASAGAHLALLTVSTILISK
jgi:acetyl esterase/lipase